MATPVGCGTKDSPELVRRFSGLTLTGQSYSRLFLAEPEFNVNLNGLKLHPRERIFWWRLCQDALPTNVWLGRRNLSEATDCPWGCSQAEDREHIITNCKCLADASLAARSWGIHIPQFSSLTEVIEAINCTSDLSRQNMFLFCGFVYQCWRARNAMRHGRPHGSPSIIAATVLGNISTTKNFTFSGHWDTNQPSRLFSNSTWCPPPPGWLKFNFDGALLPTHSGGIGVIIRDAKGDVVEAVGHYLEHWDPAQMEMIALTSIQRLIRPEMQDLKGIIIEGDNINVINFAQKQFQRKYWEESHSDSPDFSFLLLFRQVLFSHVSRNGNKVANFCASFALHHRSFWQSFDCSLVPFSLLVGEDKTNFVTV